MDGQTGCAWVALVRWCLPDWALRPGISSLPLKQRECAPALLLEYPALLSER